MGAREPAGGGEAEGQRGDWSSMGELGRSMPNMADDLLEADQEIRREGES